MIILYQGILVLNLLNTNTAKGKKKSFELVNIVQHFIKQISFISNKSRT